MPSELTLTPERRGSLSVYPIEGAREFNVDAIITDRFGGVSRAPYDSLNLATHVGDRVHDVEENRRRVAAAVGVDSAHLIMMNQVHGTQVLDVETNHDDLEGDGLVTSTPGLALAILVADCVPILLIDDASSRIGVIHAGWRGLAAGVIASALSHFDDPRTVHAFIGPCISVEGYQIGPEVATHFAAYPESVIDDVNDRSRLDLRGVTEGQLLERGVLDQHIAHSRQSTDGGELFYSDRAERPCGRFALVARRSS
ncbi:MAG: peptidoglycan editing factor PgeF [Acidimicrobiales bacterium]